LPFISSRQASKAAWEKDKPAQEMPGVQTQVHGCVIQCLSNAECFACSHACQVLAVSIPKLPSIARLPAISKHVLACKVWQTVYC